MAADQDNAVYRRQEGAIGHLVINCPHKRNAPNLAMWQAIPPLAETERETLAYADVLCQHAPQAMAASKRIVDIILGGAHDETAELAEGIRAYKERRAPVFNNMPKGE
jgi:1,4-dihydroxy-2-naphthoyl-CoA synthase